MMMGDINGIDVDMIKFLILGENFVTFNKDNNDDEYSFDNYPRESDHNSEIDSRAFLQR